MARRNLSGESELVRGLKCFKTSFKILIVFIIILFTIDITVIVMTSVMKGCDGKQVRPHDHSMITIICTGMINDHVSTIITMIFTIMIKMT